MIIGTAGHIDHGKTSLVRALTGVDCDRFAEEKRRGITLDLGYAYAESGQLRFVDVPGHERLIHNMLAGATGMDFLLLVIAADDGPMPQTREHLAIAELLGLAQGAVALSKIDAVTPERRQSARREVKELLTGTALAELPCFEVSALSGEGVAELRSHLLGAAASQAQRSATGGFRLAVDRSFTLPGAGLIVTGTAFAGTLRVEDEVVLTPPGLRARVRALRAQDRAVATGRAGERLALNLAGDLEKADVARGMWIVAPPLHQPVARVHARVRVPSSAPEALRHWMPVHAHLGAADVLARLALLEGERVEPGASMLAELIFEQPIGALWGDRFILRDQSARRTLGGGQVLDIFPPTRHKRAAARLDYLRRLESEDPAPALAQALTTEAAGVRLDRYALDRNLDDDSARRLWQRLELVVIDAPEGRSGFSAAQWQSLRERLLDAAEREHERAPDMIGIERDRLRRLTQATLARAAFDRLVGELLASGELRQSGSWLHRPEHRATLAHEDADLWRVLRPLLEVSPCNPPRVRDVARSTGIAEERVRALLKRVARLGEVYPVAHDHYFAAGAVADLAARVVRLCQRDGAARAAALRDEIGGGRKVAIHILEFFDRIGYTRRVRDEHLLRSGQDERQWIL